MLRQLTLRQDCRLTKTLSFDISKTYSYTIHHTTMSKKQTYNRKSARLNIRPKLHNNNLVSLTLLIGRMSLCNYITNQVVRWQSPTVEPNETGMSITQIYSTEPNTQNCTEGILNDSEKEKVLNRLNYIRRLHGLNSVSYNYKNDVDAAKAALITAANADNYETPNPSFRCWSEQGRLAGNNNLSYAIVYTTGNTQIAPSMNLYKSEKFVDALLMDSRRDNIACSQWLLNPFLKYISFGRVDGKSLAAKVTVPGWDAKPVERQADYISSAAIKLIFDETQDTSDLNVDSIAYPNGGYPKELFKKDVYQRGYPPMLFSVIADNKKVVNPPSVDFSNSVIERYEENGQKL